MPSPMISPTPKTLSPWQVWTPLAALPLLAFGLDFGRGPFSPKHLIFALGTACFAAAGAFALGLCAAAAIPADGKRPFARRLGRNLGLFLITLLCFIPLVLFPSEPTVSTETKGSPFEGMGCSALCGFFGPLVLGFLLHELTKSI